MLREPYGPEGDIFTLQEVRFSTSLGMGEHILGFDLDLIMHFEGGNLMESKDKRTMMKKIQAV